MLRRHSVVLLALAGAVGIPYLTSSGTGLRESAARLWSSIDGPDVTEYSAESARGPAPRERGAVVGTLAPGRVAPRWEGPPVRDLAEVFQFDVTVPWVTSRWRRVSAGLAEQGLRGYRVPLVTGTADSDLAGSLTYYFDSQQRPAKITFAGTTGDPRRLVTLVTGRYGFRRQASTDPGLVLLEDRWNGRTRGRLAIRTAQVVRADAPRARYELDLVLARQ
jgi:hypothetical protein